MSYYVYENWVAEGHKARIHFGRCPFCKDGTGIHPEAGESNGKWHDAFPDYQAAVEAARSTGAVVTNCKHCNPH